MSNRTPFKNCFFTCLSFSFERKWKERKTLRLLIRNVRADDDCRESKQQIESHFSICNKVRVLIFPRRVSSSHFLKLWMLYGVHNNFRIMKHLTDFTKQSITLSTARVIIIDLWTNNKRVHKIWVFSSSKYNPTMLQCFSYSSRKHWLRPTLLDKPSSWV